MSHGDYRKVLHDGATGDGRWAVSTKREIGEEWLRGVRAKKKKKRGVSNHVIKYSILKKKKKRGENACITTA